MGKSSRKELSICVASWRMVYRALIGLPNIHSIEPLSSSLHHSSALSTLRCPATVIFHLVDGNTNLFGMRFLIPGSVCRSCRIVLVAEVWNEAGCLSMWYCSIPRGLCTAWSWIYNEMNTIHKCTSLKLMHQIYNPVFSIYRTRSRTYNREFSDSNRILVI